MANIPQDPINGNGNPPTFPPFTVDFSLLRPDEAARQAQKILIERKAPLFQQGKNLVTIVTTRIPMPDWEYVFPTPSILCRDKLLDICCQFVNFTRFNKKEKKYAKIPPPREVLSILATSNGDGFPPLLKITNTPFLLPNGDLFNRPNSYEPNSGTFLGPSTKIEEIPASPTRKDAEAAAHKILWLIQEFAFEDELSRSVAFSGLLTPVLRSLYAACPIHCISSPTYGSGKSYYSTLASALAIGRPPTVIAMGRDSDELDKRLEAELMLGRQIISIDNVNRTLNSDRLAQAAEQLVLGCRILGKSEMVDILNTTCIYLNGVNIITPGDMARRTLTCHIQQTEIHPNLHKFTHNPLKETTTQRPKFLQAALTLGRFILQNPTQHSTQLGSFEQWAKIIPPICSIAKLPDPIESILNLQNDASYPDEDCEIIQKLHTRFHPNHFTVKNIRDAMEADYSLKELLAPITTAKNGHVDHQKIGYWLKSRQNKIINNLMLKQKSILNGSKIWITKNVLPQ